MSNHTGTMERDQAIDRIVHWPNAKRQTKPVSGHHTASFCQLPVNASRSVSCTVPYCTPDQMALVSPTRFPLPASHPTFSSSQPLSSTTSSCLSFARTRARSPFDHPRQSTASFSRSFFCTSASSCTSTRKILTSARDADIGLDAVLRSEGEHPPVYLYRLVGEFRPFFRAV